MKVDYSGIRAEMARRKISQRQLAERLGVHYNTVNNWLRGDTSPGLESILDALIAIGLTPDEIMQMRLGDLVTPVDDEKAPA